METKLELDQNSYFLKYHFSKNNDCTFPQQDLKYRHIKNLNTCISLRPQSGKKRLEKREGTTAYFSNLCFLFICLELSVIVPV